MNVEVKEEEEEEEKEENGGFRRETAQSPELEMVCVGGFAAAQTPAEVDGITESFGGENEAGGQLTKNQKIARLSEK